MWIFEYIAEYLEEFKLKIDVVIPLETILFCDIKSINPTDCVVPTPVLEIKVSCKILISKLEMSNIY